MLKVKNLNLSRENKEILKNINVEFQPGKITAVIGENGSGKTTLLKTLTGIWPPASGEIKWQDLILPGNEVEFKKQSGLLFENPFFYESLTGREFIKILCGLRKIEFNEKNIEKFISIFSLEDYINTPVNELPKGVKQKFAIISVLFHDPSIILLDEPVNGLDPVSVKILKELLVNSKNQGKTVVICTHILELAEKLADNIVVLHEGEIIYSDSLKNLQSTNENKMLEEIFIKLTGGEKYKKLLSLI
ncbi:MAG: ABC transporter ATP-binding protein [Candidatus Muiribacteriota bacterium]